MIMESNIRDYEVENNPELHFLYDKFELQKKKKTFKVRNSTILIY